MLLDGKPLQEYRVSAGAPEGSILVATLFLSYTNELLDDVIYNVSMLMILLSILGVSKNLICCNN